MIPMWKTEEKDKKSQKKTVKMAQNASNNAILPPEKPQNPTL